MSKGLKVTFLIHFIVAIIFAIGFLFFPGMVLGWWGFSSPGPAVLTRIMGAYLLAVGVSSWLGYSASEPQQVRIVVAMEVWLTVVGALVTLYGIIFEGAPALMWVNFAIFAIFAVLWIVFYPRTAKA